MYQNTISNWKSRNAKDSINNHEIPLTEMNPRRVSLFLDDFRRAYPQKNTEYIFLTSVAVDDWKFLAKFYTGTSRHHYGANAQMISFYDMWALADIFLEKCKVRNGYSLKVWTDEKNRYIKTSRKVINDYNSRKQVILCVFDYENLETGEIINAPGLLSTSYRKKSKTGKYEPKRSIIYIDYFLNKTLFIKDEAIKISFTGFTKNLYIRSKIHNFDEDKLTQDLHYGPDSIKKLIQYGKSHNLTVLNEKYDSSKVTKLVYKGPPESFNSTYAEKRRQKDAEYTELQKSVS